MTNLNNTKNKMAKNLIEEVLHEQAYAFVNSANINLDVTLIRAIRENGDKESYFSGVLNHMTVPQIVSAIESAFLEFIENHNQRVLES